MLRDVKPCKRIAYYQNVVTGARYTVPLPGNFKPPLFFYRRAHRYELRLVATLETV